MSCPCGACRGKGWTIIANAHESCRSCGGTGKLQDAIARKLCGETDTPQLDMRISDEDMKHILKLVGEGYPIMLRIFSVETEKEILHYQVPASFFVEQGLTTNDP